MEKSRKKVPPEVQDFLRGMSKEHRMLLVLKSELYNHSWQAMLDDLKNRLAGKPYIFKLAHRIEDDIERICRMRDFEKEHDVDLTEYLNHPED